MLFAMALCTEPKNLKRFCVVPMMSLKQAPLLFGTTMRTSIWLLHDPLLQRPPYFLPCRMLLFIPRGKSKIRLIDVQFTTALVIPPCPCRIATQAVIINSQLPTRLYNETPFRGLAVRTINPLHIKKLTCSTASAHTFFKKWNGRRNKL